MNDEQKNELTDRLNDFTLRLSEHLAETVAGQVKITVNGKIDDIKKTLVAQNVMHEKVRSEMKEEYMEVKLALALTNQSIQPVIDTIKVLKIGDKIVLKVAGTIAAVISFILLVLELIKNLRN